MSALTVTARVVLAALLGVEGAAALTRFQARKDRFAEAAARAAATGRTLVVVGDPHSGAHTRLLAAYDCGDVCVDLTGCPACPVGVAVDLTTGRVTAVPDNSAVVYVSCVLEYLPDPDAAVREVLRMAGDPANLFLVTVQAWTATAALYPGAAFAVTRHEDGIRSAPVSVGRKVATVAVIGLLAAFAAGAAGRGGEDDEAPR